MFVLDTDPIKSALYHCDAHVQSGLKQLPVLLSTAHHRDPHPNNWAYINDLISEPLIGKSRHVDWICACVEHYIWLGRMVDALCKEHVRRFKRTPDNWTQIKVLMKYLPNIPNTDYRVDRVPAYFPTVGGIPTDCIVRVEGNFAVTSFGLLVDRSKGNEHYFVDAVSSNRKFYKKYRRHSAKWYSGTWEPDWWLPPGTKPPVKS